MQQKATQQLPIGYWLKHTDEVITERVNQVLGDRGFTRPRWQALNLIYEAGTVTRADAFLTMKTLIDARQFDDIIDEFVQEGWLVKRGDADAAVLTLTEAGKAERDTIFRLQSEVRRRAMQGISDREYLMVIDVLQRMVKNLE